MRDDILQTTRDAFPTPIGISDNDAVSRENAGAEIRGSVASSTSETYDLPDGLMDVPQVAEYLRVSKTSACKFIERQKIPTIRIGGASACQEGRARRGAAHHGQRHLIGDPITSGISSSHKTRARPCGSRPYKTRRFSMCLYCEPLGSQMSTSTPSSVTSS